MESVKLHRTIMGVETDNSLGPHNKVVHQCSSTGFRWIISKQEGKYVAQVISLDTDEGYMVFGPKAVRGMLRTGSFMRVSTTTVEEMIDIIMETRRVN